MGFFTPYGVAIPPPHPAWVPPNLAGVLGPRPRSHAHAYPMYYFPYNAPASYQQQSWDHLAMLHVTNSSQGFPNNGPSSNEWYLDSSASNHMTGNLGDLTLSHSHSKHNLSSIIIGNGCHLPIHATGSTSLPPHSFQLRDVLFSPMSLLVLFSFVNLPRMILVLSSFTPFIFL